MTIKTIYLARRNPSISVENFPARWKQHAALAARFPSITNMFKGVVQCIKVQDADRFPHARNDYDGVNLLTMRSDVAEHATSIWKDPDTIATMRPDELSVFDDYVENFSMIARERIVLEGQLTGTCVIAFLKRQNGMDADHFIGLWRSLQEESLNSCEIYVQRLRRLVENRIVLPPPAGYEFDLVSESWFDSLDDVKALYADTKYLAHHENRLAEICDSLHTVMLPSRVVHAWPRN
jgi:hypothetical protein